MFVAYLTTFFSDSDYKGVTVNAEFGRMWKEAVVA
jgi:hypothetical protein